MLNQGYFGYIIGKKKRMIRVQKDADLLWQILVREIYVLMRHFKTKEQLKEEFEKIKTVNTRPKPKPSDIEKCKVFADFESKSEDWSKYLYYCQSSYINILEAGCIINEPNDIIGEIFILDFNKSLVNYYRKDIDGKIKHQETATIEEIMEFDEMPTKTYTEIVSEMKTEFKEYYKNLTRIEEEINKLMNLKHNAQHQGAVNIELKVINLLHDMNSERTKLNLSRRVFYTRLKALDLIED
jgi:hypothetical protein